MEIIQISGWAFHFLLKIRFRLVVTVLGISQILILRGIWGSVHPGEVKKLFGAWFGLCPLSALLGRQENKTLICDQQDVHNSRALGDSAALGISNILQKCTWMEM